MKTPSKFQNVLSFLFIFTSLFSLLLLTMLTFKNPSKFLEFNFQKQVTGSIFILICIIGIVAGIAPSKCSLTSHANKNEIQKNEDNQLINEEIIFKGHHPTCQNYSNHVFQINNRVYCSGCSGLVIGAIISLCSSIAYFFLEFNVVKVDIIFWVGFLGVTLGLLQYKLNLNRSITHLSLNIGFVMGAFLLLVGVNEKNSNFFLSFYLLSIIIYWIVVRIMLSKLEHKKICKKCELITSCDFSYR